MEQTCMNCKHRVGKYLCNIPFGEVKCRNSFPKFSEEYNAAPFLWAAEDSDNVNHPSHYETGKFECIDVMIETQGVEAVKDFCICNAFKYLYRHKNKNGTEDIKKSIWYLNKFLELEGENNEGS